MARGNLPVFELPEASATTAPLRFEDVEFDEEPFDDGSTLSPLSASYPKRFYNLPGADTPGRSSPIRSHLSPYRNTFQLNEQSHAANGSPEREKGPFNFTPQQYTVGRPPVPQSATKQIELGRRRGHKYARSSVSHQIILSPTPRPPLQLPISLPIPTFKEFRASMTKEQRNRWLFCGLQISLAAYVQFQAHESLSMTALSHLLFFDALSAILCTTVDVGRNFEVWTRSSLRNPFGLERSEVIAGLAMSIVLLFMGLDLISHGLTHSLEGAGAHVPHHLDHDRLTFGSVDTSALAAVLSTLISTASFGNHARIGRAIRPSRIPSWIPEILRNPSHLLTLSCSVLLLILPFLGTIAYSRFDAALGFTIALAMIVLGGRLCYSLARVLLMSFPASSDTEIDDLVAEIERFNGVSAVQEAKIWQVHYGLCMASFKIVVQDLGDVERVREKVNTLVKERLGVEGSRGVKWEVSSWIGIDHGRD